MPTYKVTDSTTGKTLKLTGDSPPSEQELEEIFSQYQAEPIISQKPEYTERPRTLREFITPSWMTGYKEKSGERTLLGDIFERPGAAVRSALQGRGYVRGAVRPEEVPTFQDIGLKKYYGTSAQPPSKAKIGGGFGVSAAGLAADIITNPADTLLAILGLKYPKSIKGAVGTTERVITRTGQEVAKHRPRIMGERWFEEEAKLAQRTASGLERMRSAAYENVYRKINPIEVDNIKIKDILKKWDLLDELGEPENVKTIQDTKLLSDELAKYIPQQIKKGAIYGKGGLANPKIRAMKASDELGQLIQNTVDSAEKSGFAEKGTAQQLKNLNKLAREKLYPRAEKIRAIGGYSPEPETSGISGAYRILRGSETSAGKRLAIKRAPEALKELKGYIATERRPELLEAIKTAEQLSKNMTKYRRRQISKVLLTGGGGMALFDYLLRRKAGGVILNK